MVPLLDLHDVTVAYDRRPVLWDVDFVLREPHLVGVVGPNGAGKSTLLNAILGLVPLTSGSVEIFGEPLAACATRRIRATARQHRLGISRERARRGADGQLRALGLVSPPGERRTPFGARVHRARRAGIARARADRPTYRRTTAAGADRSSHDSASRHLLHGRTDGRRRPAHGTPGGKLAR